jgi:hypothetical protein
MGVLGCFQPPTSKKSAAETSFWDELISSTISLRLRFRARDLRRAGPAKRKIFIANPVVVVAMIHDVLMRLRPSATSEITLRIAHHSALTSTLASSSNAARCSSCCNASLQCATKHMCASTGSSSNMFARTVRRRSRPRRRRTARDVSPRQSTATALPAAAHSQQQLKPACTRVNARAHVTSDTHAYVPARCCDQLFRR